MAKGAVPSAAKAPMWMWRIPRRKVRDGASGNLWINSQRGDAECGSCEGSRGHLRARIARGEVDPMVSDSL